MSLLRKTGALLGLALTGVLVAGCGTGGSRGPSAAPTREEEPSPRAAVELVSKQTICDVLFRTDGVMVNSVALMHNRQTSPGTAQQAREYARQAERIRSHARADMASKVEALSHSLRDFADWVDSPSGTFRGENFAIAGLELGNTCGIDKPTAGSSPKEAPTAPASPATSQTRHLSYFDVTTNSHLQGEGFWAANVTVCYVHPHPQANPDGTTRVSTDPWSVLIERPNGSYEQVPLSDLNQTTAGLGLQYGEELLHLGQCQTGWITVSPPGYGRFSGMKYSPKDFPNDTATWSW